MNVLLGRGSNAPVPVCRYRVLGFFEQQILQEVGMMATDEEKSWSRSMDEKELKRYCFVA
jgi:hypothetical protein